MDVREFASKTTRADKIVLGLNFSHNGSAAIVRNGDLVTAVQEERLTRAKYARISGASSSLCIEYCLAANGLNASDIDLVVAAAQGPADSAINDVFLQPDLRLARHGIPVSKIGHHLAHAWSAFACSGFEEAAVLVVDGMGSPFSDLGPDEQSLGPARARAAWETASIYHATSGGVRPVWKDGVSDGLCLEYRPEKMSYFGSLGSMYESVSELLFRGGRDAGKVMGLAPYGKPTFSPDDFFSSSQGGFEFFRTVPDCVDPDLEYSRLPQAAADLAASVQAALEQGILYLAKLAKNLVPSMNLCYAGGVALNSVANQLLFRGRMFERIFIMPAAEDSGVAVGAALFGAKTLGFPVSKRLLNDGLGKTYCAAEVSKAIASVPHVQSVESSLPNIAELLASGKIVGLFTGGSEFGPRSLGQRSILCDPRDVGAKDRINARVKHREAFRPFAPAVLAEEAEKWFDFDGTDTDSPFMLRVLPVRKEVAHRVPAIVHVDGTARVQTVGSSSPKLQALLRQFFSLTGVPILLNTSFNVMSEPIVETPEEAVLTLLENDLDAVLFDEILVERSSSFSDVWELRPQARAFEIRRRQPLLPTIDKYKERFSAVISSDLGTHEVSLSRNDAAIVARCTGKNTVSEIYRSLSNREGKTLSDFTKRIVDLRRRGVLRYAMDQ